MLPEGRSVLSAWVVGMSSRPPLQCGRSVGGCREFPGLEELQVSSRQRGYQTTDIGVPFSLHCIHRADELLEGVQSPAPLHQFQGAFPMLRGLEDEIGQRPPVEVIEVEMAVQAGATVERKVQKLMPKS